MGGPHLGVLDQDHFLSENQKAPMVVEEDWDIL